MWNKLEWCLKDGIEKQLEQHKAEKEGDWSVDDKILLTNVQKTNVIIKNKYAKKKKNAKNHEIAGLLDTIKFITRKFKPKQF